MTKKFSFVALIGALLAVAGISVASAVASPSSSQVIYACAWNNGSGNLGTPSTSSKSCPAGSTQISWNVAGPQGATGATGAKGDKGDKGDPGFNYDNAIASGDNSGSTFWNFFVGRQKCLGAGLTHVSSTELSYFWCLRSIQNSSSIAIHKVIASDGIRPRVFWISSNPCPDSFASVDSYVTSHEPTGFFVPGQEPVRYAIPSSNSCLMTGYNYGDSAETNGVLQVVGSVTP